MLLSQRIENVLTNSKSGKREKFLIAAELCLQYRSFLEAIVDQLMAKNELTNMMDDIQWDDKGNFTREEFEARLVEFKEMKKLDQKLANYIKLIQNNVHKNVKKLSKAERKALGR